MIAGREKVVSMSPPNSHLSEINILGADIFVEQKLSLMCDYKDFKVQLAFRGKWEFIPKSA